MKTIFPEKLKKGDEVRVIAPSRSINLLNEETISIATNRLESLGLRVTFGKNVKKEMHPAYGCATVEERVSDLHDAFCDPSVKAILTVIGGFNVNQILTEIDYNIIKNNPKIICGFSDITALLNAIYAKTGLVTYYGPHYSSFGMKKGFNYTMRYFQAILMEHDDVVVTDSEKWSDELWFLDQENRTFFNNKGRYVLNAGMAEGVLVGGNLCTLNLLQGTEYMPRLGGSIIFLEDDEMAGAEFMREFDRNFQSLLHCAAGKGIKGIIIGRAQCNADMTLEKWKCMLQAKKELVGIPVMIDLDFGHTTPIFTVPIGGRAKIDGEELVFINGD